MMAENAVKRTPSTSGRCIFVYAQPSSIPSITVGKLVNIADVYNIYKTKMGYAIFKSHLVISNPNVRIMRVVRIMSRASTERLHHLI